MQKPGMMISVGFGKKNQDDGLRAPDPVDGMPMKKAPGVSAAPDMHEAGEAKMDFGLIGQKYGLSEDEARAVAYDVLEACMKATGGAAHEAAEVEGAVEEAGDEGESDQLA